MSSQRDDHPARHPRLGVVLWGCLLATGLGLPAAATAQAPVPAGTVAASFTFTPDAPLAAADVTFTSTSTFTGDQNSIVSEAWDLDNDGVFGDQTGNTAVTQFAAAGTYPVALRVTDAGGRTSDATQVVTVADPPPAPESIAPAPVEVPAPAGIGPPLVAAAPVRARGALLTPFPVVRIVGRASGTGTLLQLMTITAPQTATATVRCRGGGCPFARRTQRLRDAKRGSGPAGTRTLRIHTFDGEPLGHVAQIQVFVTDPLHKGKYARFTMRRSRAPQRVDSCTAVGRAVVISCPSRAGGER